MKARLAKGPDREVTSAWLAGGMALNSSYRAYPLLGFALYRITATRLVNIAKGTYAKVLLALAIW